MSKDYNDKIYNNDYNSNKACKHFLASRVDIKESQRLNNDFFHLISLDNDDFLNADN